MKIDILTIFPEMFDGFLNTSIIKRAIEKKLVEINIVNFRDFTLDPHGKVDDTPYGGGRGMVLMVQPIYDAVMSLKKDNTKVILLTPDGEPYNQKKAYELKKYEHLIIICGHYEGFDDRIRSIVDIELSIGDYVLTGGEIASLVIIDSVTRLLNDAIRKESWEDDSFSNGLLEYPQYKRTLSYLGKEVHFVLTNGTTKDIREFR